LATGRFQNTENPVPSQAYMRREATGPLPADTFCSLLYINGMSNKLTVRRAFVASGQVQGVGFRPFVYRLAAEGGLTGTVGNTSEGVRMELQGTEDEVRRFGSRLRAELPPLARLTGVAEHDLQPVEGERDFRIVSSSGEAGHSVLVSPDMSVCADCLADMHDPANPRYQYAFTNCTNCGPRYTITRSIPYDRAVTSMSCFPLCPQCAAEYANPADRRFHAQPVACPACGPRLWFVDAKAAREGCTAPTAENINDALGRAAQTLLQGGILALKGLGGFQLACDARNAQSLRELRLRKTRPHKPLALMVGDLSTARALCALTPEHEALLQSPEKPVVLCPRREQNQPPKGAPADTAWLPPEVAPDTGKVGLMLPYTPLHAVLFDRLAALASLPPVLVMTSANAGGEPICLGNREALNRLEHLADAWLLHDRDILVRVDDSVVTLQPRLPAAADVATGVATGAASKPTGSAADAGLLSEPLFYRRARGYVPRPVFLPEAAQHAPCVLGTGAELKATICLTRGREAFVGQHIGDLENPATLAFYEEVAAHLESLLQVRPEALVCDAHPDFLSTRYAEARARREGLPLWRLQHHAAHAAAVLAENSHYGPALALCLDGTGLGDDGTVWGGELLLMELDRPHWQRMGRLAPFALPGGDAAVRQPWRIALALHAMCRQAEIPLPQLPAPWLPEQAQAAAAVQEMLRRNINCPATSSCGRLFDAVAAQLGLCLNTSYEGQAAIRLEDAASRTAEPIRAALEGRARDRVAAQLVWPVGIASRQGLLELDSTGLFAQTAQAQAQGMDTGEIAARFHLSLARALAAMAGRAARKAGVHSVGLTGGVMQNATLARLLPLALAEQGLIALVHHELPPGDGGLSLGQSVWGLRMLAAGKD